jgi:hypothetical protein
VGGSVETGIRREKQRRLESEGHGTIKSPAVASLKCIEIDLWFAGIK